MQSKLQRLCPHESLNGGAGKNAKAGFGSMPAKRLNNKNKFGLADGLHHILGRLRTVNPPSSLSLSLSSSHQNDHHHHHPHHPDHPDHPPPPPHHHHNNHHTTRTITIIYNYPCVYVSVCHLLVTIFVKVVFRCLPSGLLVHLPSLPAHQAIWTTGYSD